MTSRLPFLLCAVLASLAPAATPAWAGGSLGLDEVLAAVEGRPQIAAQIRRALQQSRLKSAKVVCTAARHGRQWTYLGGGRAAPYECPIGKRTIVITADRIYFDPKGRRLGNVDQVVASKAFARAKTFRETNFRWKWKS